MRTALIWIFGLTTAIPVARAQADQTVDTSRAVRTYSLMREDEDWSFLKDPSLRQDFWDPIKYIRLGPQGWFLTIGGEAREAFEQVGNDNWGAQHYTNTFFLQRYMLHMDWHLGKICPCVCAAQERVGIVSHWRAPADRREEARFRSRVRRGRLCDRRQLAGFASRQPGAELWVGAAGFGPRRPERTPEFRWGEAEGQGRRWRIDLFAARPDLDKPGFFDNVPNHQTAFWGAYATRPLRRRVSIDSYYLGLDRKTATFNRGTAQENRETLGLRLWRPPATKERDWDLDYEGVWQFGTFGADGIRAWTFASDSGYSFPTAPLRPRISVKADITSGDDPRHSSLGTFNPIFPI